MTPCSAMTIRRFEAGELPAPQQAVVEAHLLTCARCAATRRELAEERAALQREVPFETFAAGVAEKLAVQPRRSRLQWIAPLAAAASIAVVATVSLRHEAPYVGSKGGASMTLFVQDGAGVHALEGKVAPGAHILPAVHGVTGKRMVVTLIEPGESSVLYDGPVRDGALPQSFDWTGSGKARITVAIDGKVVAEAPLAR